MSINRLRSGLINWAFVAPALILLLAFSYYPLLHAGWLSFFDWNLLSEPIHVGFDKYRQLFDSSNFRTSVRVTIVFTALTAAATYLVALGAALLIERPTRWNRLVRTAALLPTVTPMLIAGIVWRWIFEPSNGILNSTLGFVGVEGPNWLFDPQLALIAVVIVTLWRDFGIYMLILLGGILQIPTDVKEAAAVDGCTGVKELWYITLPSIRHSNVLVAVLLMFNALQAYDQIAVMTGGGPGNATTTILTLVFKYIGASDIGSAAAASVSLFVAVGFLAVVRSRVNRNTDVAGV